MKRYIKEIRLGELAKKIEKRRKELFRIYKEYEEFFDEELPLHHLLPHRLVEIEHEGPLTILAFSDYRIHEFEPLLDYVDRLGMKPDLIVYAGDDIMRFAPSPFKSLHVLRAGKRYPEELVDVRVVNDGLPHYFGFILLLSKRFKGPPQNRVLPMLKLVRRIRKALQSSRLESPEVLRKFLTRISPSLKVEVVGHQWQPDRRQVIIKDTTTKTRVLTLELDESGKLREPPIKDGYRALRHLYENEESELPTYMLPIYIRVHEDKHYSYYYVTIDNRLSHNRFKRLAIRKRLAEKTEHGERPDRNFFEELAKRAKYGLLAVIGNDEGPEARLWIYGENVYDLHGTVFKVGPFLITGIEGSTDGLGDSGEYFEGDVKLRLEFVQSMLKHDERLIIVSHTPPRGVLDRALRYGEEAIGSLALRDFVEEEKRVCLVICGHVHSCGGRYDRLNNAVIVNASSHDDPYSRANIALITVEPDGSVDVKIDKLPSLIECLLKRGTIKEELVEKARLSEKEASYFIEAAKMYGPEIYEHLEDLAHIKFRYGLPWNIMFEFYKRGIRLSMDINENAFQDVLTEARGLDRAHLRRARAKFLREMKKGAVGLLTPFPLRESEKVIIYDTEYNYERGVLYGFLDPSTGEIKQFWFDEVEDAIEYLRGKKGYVFVHYGGHDKRILQEELHHDAPTFNLLYFVQTSLVAPIDSASLENVHDVLCGHISDKWWETYFYDMGGLTKLVLCNEILNNPDNLKLRKKLAEANKADIIALHRVMTRIKELPVIKGSSFVHNDNTSMEGDGVSEGSGGRLSGSIIKPRGLR
jgi:Icc-related predicted phosphoesterase